MQLHVSPLHCLFCCCLVICNSLIPCCMIAVAFQAPFQVYCYQLFVSLALPVSLSVYFPLQRITGVSMRHIKHPPATVLMDGWMVHYTSKSTLVSITQALSTLTVNRKSWSNMPNTVEHSLHLIYQSHQSTKHHRYTRQ